MTIVNPYLPKTQKASKFGSPNSTTSSSGKYIQGNKKLQTKTNITQQQSTTKVVTPPKQTKPSIRRNNNDALYKNDINGTQGTIPSKGSIKQPTTGTTNKTATTNTRTKNSSPKSIITKKKINPKASFKAQLRKEINTLKKQKHKHIQHQQHMQEQKIRDEQRKQKQILKEKLEHEKEARRQQKIRDKKEKKEAMKFKLQRDLEMKRKMEMEKIAKKKRDKEEREKLKEEKRKEREVQRQLELEKRREEARKRAQQMQLQQQQVMQSRMGFSQPQVQIQPNSNLNIMSNGLALHQEQQQHMIVSQNPQQNANHSMQSMIYAQMNPMNAFNNGFSHYYSPFVVNSMFTHNQNFSTFGLSFNPYSYNPSAMNNISTQSKPSSISTPIPRSTTTSTRKKNTTKPKVMTLHENPLQLPSPFVKTHVILPYTIVISKEEGQNFGLNIRYETRGTFVEVVNEESKQDNSSDVTKKDVDLVEGQNVKEVVPMKKESNGSLITSSSLLQIKETIGDMTRNADNCVKGSQDMTIKGDGVDSLKSNASNEIMSQQKTLNVSTVQNNTATSSASTPILNLKETSKSQEPGTLNGNGNVLSDPNVTGCDLKKGIEKDLPSNVKSIFEEAPKSTNMAANIERSNIQKAPTCAVKPSTETSINCSSQNPTSSNTANSDHTSNATQTNFSIVPTLNIPKRPKKKKISFGVMSVIGAEKQNNRAAPGTTQDKLIQTNDIILKINDKCITGMTFQEAAKLFSEVDNINGHNDQIDQSSNELERQKKKILKCVLTVAREKKVVKIINKLASLEKDANESNRKKNNAMKSSKEKDPSNENVDVKKSEPSIALVPALSKVSMIIDESKNVIISGDFTPNEVEALIYGVRHCYGNIKSFDLEHNDTGDHVVSIFDMISKNPLFYSIVKQRDAGDFVKKWFHTTGKMENNINLSAMKRLKAEWKTEKRMGSLDDKFQYMLESQRSIMRNLPRPSRGCKCGSRDHEFVSDPECILYRNLRQKFPTECILPNQPKKKLFEKYEGNLNSIGSAYLHRAKIRFEQEQAEQSEAEFVAKMENLQLKRMKMAIFSPNVLTILVLSAIATVQDRSRCKDNKTTQDGDIGGSQNNVQDLSENILGKRRTNEGGLDGDVTKRRRLSTSLGINSYCLAELLLHISKTWGHQYKEPDHGDYAWYVYMKIVSFTCILFLTLNIS